MVTFGGGASTGGRTCDSKCCALIGCLSILVLVIAIPIGIVGTRQTRAIRNLQRPEIFFSNSAAGKDGYTYVGSLFRGSGFWTRKKDLPLFGSMADFGVAAVGDFIYIIGGVDSNGTVYNSTVRFDPQLQKYEMLAPMPDGPRMRFGIAVIANKIYVAGGRVSESTDVLKTLIIYDTISNTWHSGADTIDSHCDGCAAAIDGMVYFAGGFGNDYSSITTLEAYNPDINQWQQMADMPTTRGDLMCASLESTKMFYAMGGYFDINPANAFSNKTEAFDPRKNEWTRMPDMPTPRGDGVAMVLPGDKIMIVGGEGHYNQSQMLKYPKHVNEVFYPNDSIWIQKAMIPTARFRLGGAVVGGVAWTLGGVDVCVLNNYNESCPVLGVVEAFLDIDHPPIFTYIKGKEFWETHAPVYPF